MNTNILIAGVGGQGVNSLSIALQKACIKEGLYCKSSIFKGGAQKRGAIYSFIRIFSKKTAHIENFGGEIATGDLDVMLALEYNESIRYMKYYNADTRLIINRNEIAFFSKRYKENMLEVNPTEVLKKHYHKLTIADYSQESLDYFQHKKMSNFIMGIQAIRKGNLPIKETVFLEEFSKNISFSTEVLTKMKAYVLST